jgi:RNA polymerase sigma-70 factor, ECF subfamily
MRGIAGGDRNALDLLYQRYSPVVLAICQRIVGDRGIAEDLLIDVYFELWRKADRYDETRGRPLTYITTLARSRAIDRKRSRALRTLPVGIEGIDSIASDDRISPEPSPAASVELLEQAEKVREILAKLEDEHRKSLELSYFEGLSHTQIAARLGKPLGTIKTHIRVGLIRMREMLRTHP